MSPITPIFMTFLMAVQVFVQNYYTKFHENPTSCSVADTRSQINVRSYFPIDTFFSRKKTYKEVNLSLRTPTNHKEGLLQASQQFILYVQMNTVHSITLLCIRKTTEVGHLPPKVLFATRPTSGPGLLSN